MEKKVGYAVVGLGVGMLHVDAAALCPDAKLIAVCDLLEDRLDKAKGKYPDVLIYTSFDKMLMNKDIDCISIAVPSYLHAELAVKAMEAKKHVLVEKPIDITVEAAQKIEEARIRTGMKCGVVHQNRNNAVMKPYKEAIEQGALGKIIFGTFEVKWYRNQAYYDNGGWRGTWDKDGGGSLMNQSVHTVDLMQWLMGDVKSVRSIMRIAAHKIETEDLTMSIFEFQNGATASFISTTCAYPGLGTWINVYGEKGSVEVNGSDLETWKIIGDDPSVEKEMKEKYQGTAAAASLDPTKAVGHLSIVQDMIDAVMKDHDPQILPYEAIKSVRIVNAIYESARTGETIYFD